MLEASLTARQGYVLQCLAVASVAGTGTEIDSLACILVEVATMLRPAEAEGMEIDAMDEDALLQTPALSVDQPAVTPAPLAGTTPTTVGPISLAHGCCRRRRLRGQPRWGRRHGRPAAGTADVGQAEEQQQPKEGEEESCGGTCPWCNSFLLNGRHRFQRPRRPRGMSHLRTAVHGKKHRQTKRRQRGKRKKMPMTSF